MEKRQKYNKLILEKLSKLIDKYPDLRFGQILVNCEIIELTFNGITMSALDPFNEESEVTWNRMLTNKFANYELFN